MPKKNDILELGEFGRKKRVNSRNKGNAFERKIAKMLNERFETKEFCRTPGSGAFGTTHKHLPTHIKVHGDLITPQSFRFIIECKNGYNILLDDVFNKRSDFWKFIKQAEREGNQVGKEWLLIYQKTRRKPIVVTNIEIFELERASLSDGYFIYPLDKFLEMPKHFFHA